MDTRLREEMRNNNIHESTRSIIQPAKKLVNKYGQMSFGFLPSNGKYFGITVKLFEMS